MLELFIAVGFGQRQISITQFLRVLGMHAAQNRLFGTHQNLQLSKSYNWKNFSDQIREIFYRGWSTDETSRKIKKVIKFFDNFLFIPIFCWSECVQMCLKYRHFSRFLKNKIFYRKTSFTTTNHNKSFSGLWVQFFLKDSSMFCTITVTVKLFIEKNICIFSIFFFS